MKALTIWQPWQWAISKGFKPVENRTWRPPQNLVGQRIAVHAAKRIPLEKEADDFGEVLRSVDPFRRLAVLHTDSEWHLGMITCTARLVRVITDVLELDEPRDRPWFNGPVGWVLDDVVEFAPIPCRGNQGLWPVPADVLARIPQEALR